MFDKDHQLIWGLGYRRAVDATDPTPFVAFVPATRTLQWSNVFVQDEYRASEGLRLTGGAKVETNVYTGAEFLPTLRATYDVGGLGALWASASRAVRAPARLDRDFYLPAKPPYIIEGGPTFDSEVANVFELSLRGQQAAGVDYSVTVFHDQYQKLRAGQAAPTTIDNLAWGGVSGAEAWGNVDLTRDWRVSVGWMALREALHASPDAGANSVENLGNDPRQQWQVSGRPRVWRKPSTSTSMIRHVAALPAPAVPAAYTVADPAPGVDVSAGPGHQPAGPGPGATARGVRSVEFDAIRPDGFRQARMVDALRSGGSRPGQRVRRPAPPGSR